jgi:hypothetical protein
MYGLSGSSQYDPVFPPDATTRPPLSIKYFAALERSWPPNIPKDTTATLAPLSAAYVRPLAKSE